mgnify:CR=1 FL=1
MSNKCKQHSVFSVDVEDGVSLAMRDVFDRVVPQTDRVVRITDQILELLDKHDTKATFFILGQVAEVFPKLVQKIAQEQHEIAVHGYNHLLFHKMSPAHAETELRTAKRILEDLTGQAVVGHRAPAFSISPQTPWAFDVLCSCGFEYDSSIMPIRSRRYGWPGFPEQPCVITGENGQSIIEAPIKPYKLLNKALPYSGGSYLRLLPFSMIKAGFSKHPNQSILYIHPYELDTERYPDYYFQALQERPFWTQLKMRSMWVNRASTIHKLDRLLSLFEFTTMRDYLSIYQHSNSLDTYKVKSLLNTEISSD